MLAASTPERYGTDFFASCGRCGLCNDTCTLGVKPHLSAASALEVLGGAPSPLLGTWTEPIPATTSGEPPAIITVPGRDTMLYAPGSVDAFISLATALGLNTGVLPELPETGHIPLAQGLGSLPELRVPADLDMDGQQVVLLSPLEWHWASTLTQVEESGERITAPPPTKHDRGLLSRLKKTVSRSIRRHDTSDVHRTRTVHISEWNQARRLTPQEVLVDEWNMEVHGKRRMVVLHVPCVYGHDSSPAQSLTRITATVADVMIWHPSEEEPWTCGGLSAGMIGKSTERPPIHLQEDHILVTPCSMALKIFRDQGIRAQNLWEFILGEVSPLIA